MVNRTACRHEDALYVSQREKLLTILGIHHALVPAALALLIRPMTQNAFH